MSRYLLQNKNNVVAVFDMEKDHGITQFSMRQSMPGKLPIGFNTIDKWIENRSAAKHNKHLREIMARYGLTKPELFIQVTHCTSINDTFWVKRENESICWEDVSLYINQFNKIVSDLAFAGAGLPIDSFSPTTPEFTSDGSYRKCFIKEDDGIYIYKRGLTGASNVGLEPYCEVMASEIVNRICDVSVIYTLHPLHGVTASRCELFTDEQFGFASIAKIMHGEATDSEILQYLKDLGSLNEFKRMIVADSLILNTDRHLGNYGILFQNDTLDPICLAPVFDFNLALLPYATKEDCDRIGDYLVGFSPKFGDDFVEIGQGMITDEIRYDLEEMRDFSFSFRGDDVFEPWRVRFLEGMIHKQLEALLSQEKLFMKDVFIPVELNEKILKFQEEQELIQRKMPQFENVRRELEDNGYVLSALQDDHTLQLIVEAAGGEVLIDFLDEKVIRDMTVSAHVCDQIRDICGFRGNQVMVLTGLPFSGKTEYAQRLCDGNGRIEHIEAGITPAELQAEMRQAFMGNKDIVYDACNLHKDTRNHILNLALSCGSHAQLIVMRRDFDFILEDARNVGFDEGKLLGMRQLFEAEDPAKDQHWDQVQVVTLEQDLPSGAASGDVENER